MIELTQAGVSAAWLITTLLLLLQWMRQGIRKGGKCDDVQPRTGPKLAARKSSGSFWRYIRTRAFPLREFSRKMQKINWGG